jgi:dienelactone hydrolase
MESVTFGAANLPGYEAGPKSGPAIIVLQEWWGECGRAFGDALAP